MVWEMQNRLRYLCVKHNSTEDPCVPHGLPQGIQSLLCNDMCILYRAGHILTTLRFAQANEAVVTVCKWHRRKDVSNTCVHAHQGESGSAYARADASILAEKAATMLALGCIYELYLMVIMRAVREVEAGNTHSGAQEVFQDFHAAGLWTQRADDLQVNTCESDTARLEA